MIPYIIPQYELSSFNCPHCQAFSQQKWTNLYSRGIGEDIQDLKLSFCMHCEKYAIWHNGKMIFPEFNGVEPPNEDLTSEIQEDYQEAAEILQKSSRSAAALLRLAIQKLCKQLGESGENINNDIASLVKNGLSVKIQKALDTVRVIGNEAVHPGTINVKDNREIAQSLFKLVNFIAEKMITEPREIDNFYQGIPEKKRKEISKRDKIIGK